LQYTRINIVEHTTVNIKNVLFIYLDSPDHFFTCLTTQGKNIHRGEALEEAVKKTRTKVTQLVRKVGISRGTYYNHIEDPKLSYEMLEAYGKVLKYDFTQVIPQMPKYVIDEPEDSYGKPATLEEAIRQIDHWKDKYINLLEQYKDLIEKKQEG
jgi:hypothetical protein